MKKGLEFEQLTVDIFEQLIKDNPVESIEHNVQLPGIDGPRQIDILLKGNVGPIEVMTIIECKDHHCKLSVVYVDGIDSKMKDVKAQKAVLVSRLGFTDGAKRKAKRLGISLCTAHSAATERWKFALQIPIVIVEHSCETFTPSLVFAAISTKLNPGDFLSVNDIPINQIVAEYWNSNDINCRDGVNEHSFDPQLEEPNWVKIHDGRKMQISAFRITMKIRKTYFFGYLNDVDSAKYIEFHEEKQRHVLFDPNDLSDYRESFEKRFSENDIPKIDGTIHLNLKLLHNPKAVPEFRWSEK